MFYVKIKDVNYEKAIEIINSSLDLQGLNRKDLVKKIGYPFERKGMEEIELYFAGRHPKEHEVREKIGRALQISREQLLGERSFEKHEDAVRFNFCPYLVRVPENTRPSQITIFGFVGFERAFVLGRYRNLLNKQLSEQLEYVEEEIKNDTEGNGQVMFFGKKLGYAFYWDYEQPAIALSVDGKVLNDTIVTYSGYSSCSVSMKAKQIIESGAFKIPRFTPKVQVNEACVA